MYRLTLENFGLTLGAEAETQLLAISHLLREVNHQARDEPVLPHETLCGILESLHEAACHSAGGANPAVANVDGWRVTMEDVA